MVKNTKELVKIEFFRNIRATQRRKEKRKQKILKMQSIKISNKMSALSPNISITILNINSLNIPIKKE